MKKISNLIIVSMLCLFAACKKDKSASARMNLITTGSWKLFGLTTQPGSDMNGDGIIDNDLFLFYEDCEKDNIYTFKRNGEYEVNEGASKCDPSDSQVGTSHWQFANSETEIIIAGDKGKIEELTSNTLVIKGELQGETLTFTFGR